MILFAFVVWLAAFAFRFWRLILLAVITFGVLSAMGVLP